jgi:hypothetical protein
MTFENYPSGRGVIAATYEPGIDPALLPCPFCGGSEAAVENTHTASYWVECPCGAERHGESFDGRSRAAHRRSFLSAIRAWNERSQVSR